MPLCCSGGRSSLTVPGSHFSSDVNLLFQRAADVLTARAGQGRSSSAEPQAHEASLCVCRFLRLSNAIPMFQSSGWNCITSNHLVKSGWKQPFLLFFPEFGVKQGERRRQREIPTGLLHAPWNVAWLCMLAVMWANYCSPPLSPALALMIFDIYKIYTYIFIN